MRSRFKGVYVKNMITVMLLFTLSFVILGAVFAAMSYSFATEERTDSMLDCTDSAGLLIRAYNQQWQSGLDSFDIRALLSWCADMTGYRLLVTDELGVVQNCSDRSGDCGHPGSSVPAEVIAQINRTGSYRGVTTLGGLFAEPRYVVGRTLPAGPNLGCVFAADESGGTSGLWGSFARIYFGAAVVVVLLTFCVTAVVIRRESRPIKEMSDAARSYSSGDFSPRVEIGERHDEVAELAEAFNVMADSLERTEKSRRDLIANVSHELKTPMTTIAGFADGILDGTIPPEREREYLQVISSETKRLSRLVRGMLDVTALQGVTPMELRSRSFDILEVICETLLSLEQKITSRNLDVDALLPEEAIFVEGDRDAITQVVHNLLDNAAKFAEAGTTITVRLWREDGRAYVSVENRGETIPEEELPLIFDRFHKTDRSRSMDRDGVGLGLYIVKTILDSHRSAIYVTSREGVTKFEFSLRLKSAPPRRGG